MTEGALRPYADAAKQIAARFDRIDTSHIYAPVTEWLPAGPARVLDIGAGTGRDARWFRQLGHVVHAADPVPELRAASPHGDVTWYTAALPSLAGLSGPYDLITLSAVWHHLNPDLREAAMTRIMALTAPSGRCLMSLRHGATVPGTSWDVSVPHTCKLAQAAGFDVTAVVVTNAVQAANRAAGVRFTWLVLTRAT